MPSASVQVQGLQAARSRRSCLVYLSIQLDEFVGETGWYAVLAGLLRTLVPVGHSNIGDLWSVCMSSPQRKEKYRKDTTVK